ncbi:MAG: organomercurial lyase [Gemmatimonadales bacterium]
MDLDTTIKLQIYSHLARTTRPPTPAQVAAALGVTVPTVESGYQRLSQQRVLVLEPDGVSIRMAPPFSGVETQHRVRAGGKDYFANCAWDALGIPAALRQPAEVFSRCEQTLEPLRLRVHEGGPEPADCIIHFAVPAALWWKDIVFT